MLKSRLSSVAGLVLLAGCVSGPAAAETATERAAAHFDAIAQGRVAAVTAAYTEASTFQWVGGPLDGAYTGKAAIAEVWRKFTGAQGPLDVEVMNIAENANPKGATVTADVKFLGKKTIPVRYVLTYRGDALVSEIWQIDPKLGQY